MGNAFCLILKNIQLKKFPILLTMKKKHDINNINITVHRTIICVEKYQIANNRLSTSLFDIIFFITTYPFAQTKCFNLHL